MSDLRIDDFDTEAVCPYTTQVLPEIGAEAINVVWHKRGLIWDIWLMQMLGMRSLYLIANESKQLIVAELTAGRGKQIVLGFYNDTDALIYSVLTAATGRVGLSYENVCKASPSIVCAGCFAYDQDVPFVIFLTYHTLFQYEVCLFYRDVGRCSDRRTNDWQSARMPSLQDYGLGAPQHPTNH